ncbi:MAG: amidohydrolase [Chloroflexi bacterium]|nr:amidohydrolase [Chloroflexota bacterium]
MVSLSNHKLRTSEDGMDLLLANGRVYTMDARVPFAQAVAIRGNRILAVGTSERLQAEFGSTARTLDLRGRTVVSGFIDAHVHLLHFARSLQQVNLEGLDSLEAIASRLAARIRRARPGEWIEGRGWNKNLWPGESFPARAVLDRVAPRNPVLLGSRDGHALWVNSLALERAGVSAETPDPAGGRMLRDAHGAPTGVLLENAQALVWASVQRPDREALLPTLVAGVKVAQSLGLTGIHDLEDADALWCFQALEAEASLGVRVFMGLPRASLAAAEALGLQTGFGGDRLRLGPVKLFADGTLGSQTAFMLQPYETDPNNRGLATMEPQEVETAIAQARRAGLGVAVHAIGDAAVRMVLDAAERVDAAVPRRGQIVRIEHAQCVDPADVPRFARLGVVASMQPIHATSDLELAERHWGPRAAHAYAWRSLLEAGAQLAFGTDAPVEALDPLKNLYAALTRQRPDGTPAGGWHPQQRLSIQEALRAYTLGSAAAAGLAASQGTISPGKLADLVVLSHDLVALPPEALLETRVEMTVFDGQVVFGG